MGACKRYREFGDKEQREEPQVREFREFGTASYCNKSQPIVEDDP